jgi:tRNA/rRNA methyltransferase
MEPRQAAAQALDWAEDGKTALVFGPEDNGLSTGELDRCFVSVCIPTTPAASLNLAQAVMVAAYEMRLAALAGESEPAGNENRPPAPLPASQAELAGLREHLIKALAAVGVIPADNPEHFYRPFKNVLERAGVSSREVRALRGVARQILWLSGQIKKP